tara:strand:+ start:733 stop:2034 length:1302 start_codon:yes stop_codon:yes gene_type:complete
MSWILLSFEALQILALITRRITAEWVTAVVIFSILYLFYSQMNLTFWVFQDASRLVKEPLLLFVIFAFITQLIVSKVKIDVLIACISLLIPLCITFYQTGLWGGIQYTRAIICPVLLFFCLVGSKSFLSGTYSYEKRNERIGLFCFAMLLFLFLFSILHLLGYGNSWGFETLRNRINPDIMGSPFTSYSSVKRYQSFFGDPNKFALCVALLNFFIFSSLRARKLYLPTVIFSGFLVLFAESRAGYILYFMSLLFLFRYRLDNSNKLNTFVAAIVFSLIAAFSALIMFYWSSRYGVQIETSRIDLWIPLLKYISTNPIILFLGSGFGSIGQVGYEFTTNIEIFTSSGRTVNVIDSSFMSLIFFHGLSSSFIFLGYGVVIKKAYNCARLQSRMSLHIIFASIIFYSILYDSLLTFPWSFLFILLIFVQMKNDEKS